MPQMTLKGTDRAPRSGKVSVQLLRPHLIESVYEGYITGAMIDEQLPIFESLLARGGVRQWLADAFLIEGMEAACAAAGARWLRPLRERAITEFALVSAVGPVRMMAGTIGFGAGVRVKAFPSRESALAYLASLG